VVADAAAVGLGIELEFEAVRCALDQLPPDVYLSLNASPACVTSPQFDELIADVAACQLVVEITEHAHIDDYRTLNKTLDRLRAAGIRIAVDDAGAGFASLRHILHLRPDISKLDLSLTRGVDNDPIHARSSPRS
jgi:EAL domain-containing protein (putative c-di-GMP-specific phosphodiesterase class I)